MKLTTRENSTNYACTVVEIKSVFDIEGADNIKRAVVFNNNIVVSKDVKVGDKMLYFVSGTRLSEDYCVKNNLLDKAEFNSDKEKRGFISHKQFRVKSVKLRSVISDGILMPLGSLTGMGLPVAVLGLQVGDTFTDIDGTMICEKYFVPVRNSNVGGKAPKKAVKISRMVDNQFYLHSDTTNLRRNMHCIQPNDIIGIHKKKHGTSIVIGNVLVKRKLSWLEKLSKRLGVQVIDTEYDVVFSSRKVIKNGDLNPDARSFYKIDIWGDVVKEVRHLIPKNYSLYGEILGKTKDDSWIQGGYDYGCKQGEHKFYVYRITVVNSDGFRIELTDLQIKEFCDQNGLLYSDTLLYYGYAKDLYPDIVVDENWHDQVLSQLERDYNEKDCDMCVNSVPEEGIVLRKETLQNYEAFKLKSKRFLLRESEAQEKDMSNLEDEQA